MREGKKLELLMEQKKKILPLTLQLPNTKPHDVVLLFCFVHYYYYLRGADADTKDCTTTPLTAPQPSSSVLPNP